MCRAQDKKKVKYPHFQEMDARQSNPQSFSSPVSIAKVEKRFH